MEKKLNELLKDEKDGIMIAVLEDAIERGSYEDSVSYLKDVVQYGCVSGTVSRLIYYSDTYSFFDDNYEEIMDTINEYEQEFGSKPQWESNIKNWFAWFSYEWACHKLLNILEEY